MKQVFTVFMLLIASFLWGQSPRLVVPMGHLNGITSVAFSPNGKYILTGSLDKTAKLWNINGKEILTFNHNKSVESAAFSPDGKYILTRSRDSTIQQWDITNGEMLKKYKETKGFDKKTGMGSQNGKRLLSFYGNSLEIKGAKTYKILLELKGHKKTIELAIFSPDGKIVVSYSQDTTLIIWNAQNGNLIHTLRPHENEVSSLSFSPDGKYFLTGSWDQTAKLWDLDGNLIQTYRGNAHYFFKADISFDGNNILLPTNQTTAKLWNIKDRQVKAFTGWYTADISPDGQYIVTGNMDGTVMLWDINGNRLHTFYGHNNPIWSVTFSPDSKYILTGSRDEYSILWNLDGRKIKNYGFSYGAAFSTDGQYIFSGYNLLDLQGKSISNFKESRSDAVFSSDNKHILGVDVLNGNSAILSDLNGKMINIFKDNDIQSEEFNIAPRYILSVAFSPDKKYILTGNNDLFEAKLWDITSGREIRKFKGHTGLVNGVSFFPDGQHILTSSGDNTARIWDVNTGKELATLIAIDSTDWVVTTPSGLFDASTGAMKLMHYVQDLEVIELDQLKDRYYEPGLLAKIMGFDKGGFRSVSELSTVALHPEIKADIDKDHLSVTLTERNGGIGKVALLLNNDIELDGNINPGFKTGFEVDLGRFARYFIADTVNQLSLVAYNNEGWLKGQPYLLEYRPFVHGKGPGDRKSLNELTDVSLQKIHLYALVIGTSHFSGKQLDLAFPDKDASSMAEALRVAGTELFGKNVDVKLLNTSAEPWPRKSEIAKAFQDIAAKADPSDILLVYFSGHGITYPPDSEKGQFYYLTTDISSDKLDDPVVRNTAAIAQDTLQKWINQVTARKRILILDACNSGRVVESLEPGAKELNSDQRRALERMKDRSGMFVLAGSAANKSSFEASPYGHGLLTYSLLNNMPRVAAANKTYIDVEKLFGNVREEVPLLAKKIQQEQEPELIGSDSYDIGIINEKVHIEVPLAKPVFVRAIFLDIQKSKDLWNLSNAVNELFEHRAADPKPSIAFWNISDFNGDHYYLGGQYQLVGETISGKANLFRMDKEVGSFQFSGTKDKLSALAIQIYNEVIGLLERE